MSTREFIALGTGSQVPTRRRNHNGYLLRWDDEGFLFDPGEGTQRQLAYGELAVSAITHVCITHFHGDHCLGLAGIIQRLSLDRVPHPVFVHYPASGQAFFERLRYASLYHPAVDLRPCPFEAPAGALTALHTTPRFTLYAHPLEHSVPAYGYRLEEPVGRRFLPERLAAAGVSGPRIAELQRNGSLQCGERLVTLDEVTESKPGAAVAFVMDTGVCSGAVALARDADLAVFEATYTAEDQALATEHAHLSAADAGRLAHEAGARALALTHFSQRYGDTRQHLDDARAHFAGALYALDDLARVPVPRRR